MYWSKTDNTQLLYDIKYQWKYHSIWLTEKHPSKVTHKWSVATMKAYYNSEKIYAKRAMRKHETPAPYYRHKTYGRWD